MFHKIISPIILILLLTAVYYAQTPEKQSRKQEISAEIKKQAVEFLRETADEVNTLRTPENRIGFNAEMANLMWFHDEKEARAMFRSVINDFKQMLAQIDAQLSAMNIKPQENDVFDSFLIPNETPQAQLLQKFNKAISVRQQIALALAEHDAPLAYEFFTETAKAISNAELRRQFEMRDNSVEVSLLKSIAEQDVDKALELARKTLAKGFNYETVNVVKKIYEKDAEKGAAFGDEVAQKLKSESAKLENHYYFAMILDAGLINLEEVKKNNKKPMFSEQNLRDIAEILAQRMLKTSPEFNEYGEYNLDKIIRNIEKVLPARAAQIRQKIAVKDNKGQAAEKEEIAVNTNSQSPAQRERAEQEELFKNLSELNDQKLSGEERAKFIGEARKTIAKIGDRSARLMALSSLAIQVGKMGDRELAATILKEAESLINPQPKTYRDYLETWMLASGYAAVDAEKAFPILEGAIFRLNDTISAFIKVGEFIDVNSEMIDDGEVQVGSFGGNMARGFLSELDAANNTIFSLAVADFSRTKALTNKIDRAEIRILAKMLILRSILGEKKVIRED